MHGTMIKEREREILLYITERYLTVGLPVSSGFVAKNCGYQISSATVRNIMVELERQGFLEQPHTSAGRIPTDKGLRFYVNSLLFDIPLPSRSVDFSPDEIKGEEGDLNSYLLKVSNLLSEYSDNLGFVLSPRISALNFKHIRFIKVAPEKVMIILITSSNLVLTEISETKSYFTQLELDKASQYINENFRGRNLIQVRDFLLNEMPKHRSLYEDSVQKLLILLKSYIFDEKLKSRVILQGTSKLLDKPELFSMDRLKSLFENFETKAKLARLLSDFISLDRVKVIIGSELELSDISECALILSHYGSQNQVLGSLGIIGPKRISYKKIIPFVDCVAKKLSDTIIYFQ